jgi:hypothetical protein
MGFQFGLMDTIDASHVLESFVLVVVFVVCFEYSTGILDEVLTSHYSHIMEVIYKELTIMGVISFIVIMYEASHSDLTTEEEKIIVSMDFAHIVLFYMTIFFVIHAFALIRISLFNYRRYRKFFAYSLTSLVEETNKANKNPFSWFFFHYDLFGTSSLREKVEFKMIHYLFNAIYLVPKNFNFPAYLSGCYLRYVLRTLHRSIMSWAVLIFVVLINYSKIKAGLNCLGHADEESSSSTESQYYSSNSHYYSSNSHNSHHHHRYLVTTAARPNNNNNNNNMMFPMIHRLLASSSEETKTVSEECKIQLLQAFLFAGALITLFNIILLLISRLYKLRLAMLTGVHGTCDFTEFLKLKRMKK